jgi:predicted Rossmann fold flavoprotein
MLPIVVVGAGAAGLTAAIFAANTGRRVVLLERTRDGGRKILIAGGGRCNVLPSSLSPAQYITESSPNTLKKMLFSWPLPEQRRFFEQTLDIPLALEQGTGKLFPVSNRARDVRDALVRRAERNGVEIRYSCLFRDVEPFSAREAGEPSARRWRVLTADGAMEASSVILATGGLSVPATGSDGTGLRVLERLGHTIHPTYPALTPLTATPPPHAELAGVSLDVTLEAPQARGRMVTSGGFLFTHRGYSGPAVLNISHVAVRSRLRDGGRLPIFVRWSELDATAWDLELRGGGSGLVAGHLRRRMPARLADALLQEAGIAADAALAGLRREDRSRLVAMLTRYELPWTGDEGYRKAEVTGGGVALGEVSLPAMESRLHRGLHICGELLDAFGPIGGYNFAWAWATGRAAGIGAAAASVRD